MSIWQRLKSIWRLGGIEETKLTTFPSKCLEDKNKNWVEGVIKNKFPQRLAKIVQEPLPDNLEEDDNTNQ